MKYKNFEYIMRFPENYVENEKYPLLICLHGAGARGRDISIIKDYPLFKVFDKNLENRFITVMPQCFADTWFEIFEQLQEFVCYITNQDYVDKKRVYLIGASMGAYATWQMAMTRPDIFSAIVPICGGGMYWNALRLKDMGIWAFHGMLDEIVFPEESIKMVNAVNKNGGNAQITLYPQNKHDAWTDTYNNTEVFDWMLRFSKD